MPGKLGHLIEEKGASVSQFESALFVPNRPRKGAFHMAENFALQQSFGQGPAIYRHERTARPGAFVVNGGGNQLFSSPCFPGYVYGIISHGKISDLLVYIEHLAVRADDS